MIPEEATLKRFLKARMNFFVYGPRASGKTTLLKNMFKQTNIEYIYINCTMGDKKNNFFKYLNHELDKFFRRKLLEEQSKTLLESYEKPPDPLSVHAWIENIKNLDPDIRAYLQNIYLLIDNIEEIHLSANFITTFFSACQQNAIDDLKIPFVFCGITLPRKIYATDKPFRNIISFCMRKPIELMKKIINQIIESRLMSNFKENGFKRKQFPVEDIKNAADILSLQFFHAFEPMETDLNRIKKMTSVLVDQILLLIQNQIVQDSELKKPEKTLKQRINFKINKGQIKMYTRQILQNGPVDQFIMQRIISKQVQNEDPMVELPYQYYPNLILTSLHLADLAPQNEDRRRFVDYKKQKGKPSKSNKNNYIEGRITKHNLQRVIAISESLESIGKKDGPEFTLAHHSIFYYGCFQFLREEKKIFTQGKNLAFGSTKIYGDTKQQQAKTFIKAKLDQNYKDFVPQSLS